MHHQAIIFMLIQAGNRSKIKRTDRKIYKKQKITWQRNKNALPWLASGIWHLACQTYALSFIDSHSGQNRGPQLFSSPKSFRVAKSTPSSAKSSAKLSPISKWLFRPPLLRKSALVFSPLLLLSYTQGAQALSATTINVIEGSAPYLTFDGGQTKATDINSLLYIELPDGIRITQSTNTSSATNPIILPSSNLTFNDIRMVIPSGETSANLDSIISQGMWGDDDEDGQEAGGVTVSGSISLTIKDKDGATVSRSDTLSICNAPYQVTLSSTAGNLVTQYGVPNSSTFSGGKADYYITLPPQPVICSVMPNLDAGAGSFKGPANIWNPDKGFFVQSTNPSSYGLNFPTTGANGLHFDLDIAGIDASQLRWTVNTNGRLGATVSWEKARLNQDIDPFSGIAQNDVGVRDESKYITRITLSGPKADSAQINSSSPGRITVPSLPQTFELVGRDSNDNEIRYGFVLKQWFVNRGAQKVRVSEQTAWCNSLGYRMPRVKDLTNAKCGMDNRDFPCVNGIDGAVPSSGHNIYKRYIGAGFFTEWGDMSYYADTGFIDDDYWTSDVVDSTNNFAVISDFGYIHNRHASYSRRAVCTTP